jgi:hypothetical protein
MADGDQEAERIEEILALCDEIPRPPNGAWRRVIPIAMIKEIDCPSGSLEADR